MRTMKRNEYTTTGGKYSVLAIGVIIFLLIFLGGTMTGAALIGHGTLPQASGKAVTLITAAIAMFFSVQTAARKEKPGNILFSVLTFLLNLLLMFGVCMLVREQRSVSILLPLAISFASAFIGFFAGKKSSSVRYP